MRSWRWGLMSFAAGLFALVSIFGALVLLPARAEFDLTTVSGSLTQCNEGFCVDDRPIYFGPDWYLMGTESPVDYNRDGVTGSLLEELQGLLGGDVFAEVSASGAGGDVYVFNGSPWRGIAQEAPWSESGSSPTPEPDTTDAAADAGPAPGQPLVGEMQPCGSTWCVDGQVLYLGPWWYLQHGDAARDFDGDGAVESPASELNGLDGTAVTVEGRLEGGEYVVLTINGEFWRPFAGPPPWSGGPSETTGLVATDSFDETEKDDPAVVPGPAGTGSEEGADDPGTDNALPEPADHDRPPVPGNAGPPAGVPASPGS